MDVELEFVKALVYNIGLKSELVSGNVVLGIRPTLPVKNVSLCLEMICLRARLFLAQLFVIGHREKGNKELFLLVQSLETWLRNLEILIRRKVGINLI